MRSQTTHLLACTETPLGEEDRTKRSWIGGSGEQDGKVERSHCIDHVVVYQYDVYTVNFITQDTMKKGTVHSNEPNACPQLSWRHV